MRPPTLVPDLEFAPGDALQVALVSQSDFAHHDVTVLGGLRDRSLIVTQLQRAGQPLPVEEGAGVQARFYRRNQALGFNTTVLRVCRTPYPYLHLVYPTRVEVLQERKSARVRSALAATVRRRAAEPGETDTPGVVRDLSILGAMLLTPVPVGGDGDILTISLRLPLDQIGDELVTLPATIRNVQEEAEGSGSPWRHRYGVGFGVLDPQTIILLRAYLYERFSGF